MAARGRLGRMSDEDSTALERTKKAGADLARDLGVALVASILTGAAIGPALAGVAAGSLGLLLWKHIESSPPDDVEACCDRLAKEMAARLVAHGDDRQAAAAMASEFLSDAKRSRTLRTGLATMMDVTTTRAWPCIAALVAEYWDAGRTVDGFFKDATGFLTEVVDEDLDAIAFVLAHGKSQFEAMPKLAPPLTLNYNRGSRNELTIPFPHELEKPEHWVAMDASPARGMQLLDRHRFGDYLHEQITIRERIEDCWRLLALLELRERQVE